MQTIGYGICVHYLVALHSKSYNNSDKEGKEEGRWEVEGLKGRGDGRVKGERRWKG